MKKKLDSYLGFAKKSGNLVSGSNTCNIMGEKGRLKLLIIAEDVAENSKNKMLKLARKESIPYRIYGESDHISKVTGNSGRSVFGIVDKNFAEIIINMIDLEKSEDEEVL